MDVDRRQFLATATTGGLVSLTGCLDALGDGGGIGDDTSRKLRLDLSTAPTPLRSDYVVDLSSTERPWDERAFAATLDGDTYTTQYRRPFGSRPDEPKYTRHEGTYYRLDGLVVDEATATRPVLRLSAVSDAGSDDAPEAVAADSLPEFDRTAVHVAHMAARARGNEGGAPWGVVRRGGFVYRREADAERSRLVGDGGPSHVIYHGRVYAVEVSRERFYEPVYRATVDPVAETPERMEAILRAQLVDVRLSEATLSSDARSILREAQGEGYAETHPYSSAYRTLLTALHARAYLDGNIEKDAYVDDLGSGMVRYDGRYYVYRLRFLSVDAA
ncbi:MAG: hypothetical protein ABEJ73_05310 [Haloplanus sp.]